jgi:hypothetical protein
MILKKYCMIWCCFLAFGARGVQASAADIGGQLAPYVTVAGAISHVVVALPQFQIRGLKKVSCDSPLYIHVQTIYRDFTGATDEVAVLEDRQGQFTYRMVDCNDVPYLLVNPDMCRVYASLLARDDVAAALNAGKRAEAEALAQGVAAAGQGDSDWERFVICLQCASLTLAHPQRWVRADLGLAIIKMIGFGAIAAVVNRVAASRGWGVRMLLSFCGATCFGFGGEKILGHLVYRVDQRAAAHLALEYAHKKGQLKAWGGSMLRLYRLIEAVPVPFVAQQLLFAKKLSPKEWADIFEQYLEAHA